MNCEIELMRNEKCKKDVTIIDTNKVDLIHPNYVKLLIIPDETLLSLVDNFIEAVFNEYTYINTVEKMKTRKKCIITNILEAQKKFYESNMIENPLFHYNIPDEEVDNIFNMCNGEKIDFHLFHEARRIIQIVKEKFKTYENYENCVFGNDHVTKDEFKEYLQKYLRKVGINDKVEIVFKENLISAVQILKKKNGYFLQLQCQDVKKKMMPSLCNHEIGTHLFRMINHNNNNLKKYNIDSCCATEEGLAVINSMYSLKKNHLFLIFPAIKYLTVCLGKFYPFSKLYIFLNDFVKDSDRCFKMCARVKRGLRDTASPGSVYHDQFYFIGSYSILKWYKNIDFPLLYSGNIGLKCLSNISNYVNVKNNILPPFLSNQEKLNTYLQFLEEVSYINGITPERCSFIEDKRKCESNPLRA
ncbi:conserved protein, unknown function [Plasmodium ovale wallikeri]|uniref:Uncharacterized protein n=2 Tax=Plasmodium ovale TaxID=36330 RepID=A0A1A8YUA5_PLAOA|nr:conserved protein, unknown function [Plasmodium ovale wallikeri]SBT35459.1 conserved protein, unknown function [Plasmodium ovale wallikeri]SBT77009.1 conserved protein, unknown function [Plasmodium ovale]